MKIVTDPLSQVQKLASGMKNKIMRIGLSKASAIVKSAVIDNAPAITGALKQSIRIRLKRYMDGARWISVIGPSMKFKRTLKRKSKNSAGIYYRPARIAHLVERSKRFIATSKSQTQQQFLDTLQDKIGEQIKEILAA